MPSIGKYEILEQLGAGSMGTVYRGRDTLLDRMVAIKTIRTGVNVELEAKERFYREARTCARLNHPHIVSVYDLGEEAGVSFIAMELLNGSDFRQLIERKEEVPLPVKLTAMAQVCEALAHAHREGIIHRDIKPSNLFLLADQRAKVVDFGIAKLPTSHLTRAGAILGTPNYMAPEQINGAACDGRADLFAAAVVFFEWLTFHHPFKSNLIPRRILEDAPDSLFQHAPTLPRILEKIFTRALQKEPAKRYSTGDEFAADLRTVLDAVELNASPTFSRLELPSQSSFAVPPPIPAPSDPVAPVLGDTASGDHEWRVSRILKLLPIFDSQLASGDTQSARCTLTELQSVAGSDARFQESVEKCRVQLATRPGSQARPVAPPPPSLPSSSTTFVNLKKCARCGASNRPDSTFCMECGAAISGGPPTTGTGFSSQSGMLPPLPPVTPAPKPASSASRLLADKKRLSLVIAGVAIAAVLLVVAPMFFRTVKQEPFVATARVAAPQVHVFSEPSPTAKELFMKPRGSRLNVLALPKLITGDWVRVQAREGDTFSRPGYLKAADLTEWEAKDPDAALILARMSGPMENGSDPELRAQIDKLNSVAAAFSGKLAAGMASLDAAKLELILARHAKDSGQPEVDWKASLADITNRVEALRSTPALQSGGDDLLRQIHDLIAAPVAAGATGPPAILPVGTPPVTVVPGTPSLVTPPVALTDAEIRVMLQKADEYRKDHRYNDARRLVIRAIRSQPKNSDAQILLKKIDAAIELERSPQ